MKTAVAKPVHEFRVYPSKGSLYFLVSVFESKRDMYSYCETICSKHTGGKLGRDFAAICHSFMKISYAKGKKGRWSPIVGHLHFTRRELTMEVVTHEAGHAAHAWFRRIYRKRGDFDDIRFEEAYCYALGDIAREIVRRTRKITIERWPRVKQVGI